MLTSLLTSLFGSQLVVGGGGANTCVTEAPPEEEVRVREGFGARIRLERGMYEAEEVSKWIVGFKRD